MRSKVGISGFECLESLEYFVLRRSAVARHIEGSYHHPLAATNVPGMMSNPVRRDFVIDIRAGALPRV